MKQQEAVTSIRSLLSAAETHVSDQFRRIEEIAYMNQSRVLDAFREYRVSDHHLQTSTGYGFNDTGRETIESLYAAIFGGEAALVRPHFVSGTHALSAALFGLLRPNDHLLFLTGDPYDTLQGVAGLRDEPGSLREWGIKASVCQLTYNGEVDFEQALTLLHPNTKVVAIQRSSGYDWRRSFSIENIQEMVLWIRQHAPQAYVLVDNCYGEFVELMEPAHVGADLMVGSLIKNPGGGLAHSGGYAVGKKICIDKMAVQWSAPGIGGEQGASFGQNRLILQGLFLAPHVVSCAVKGAVLAAYVFESFGLRTKPLWNESRTDLIQAVEWGDPEALIRFCQAVQSASPVDSSARPEPWDMPGYENPVIMAAGTFVQGGTLELSADGPIREPYIGYMQGGLTYEHCKYALERILLELHEAKLIHLPEF